MTGYHAHWMYQQSVVYYRCWFSAASSLLFLFFCLDTYPIPLIIRSVTGTLFFTLNGWATFLFGLGMIYLKIKAEEYQDGLSSFYAEPALLRWSPLEHEKHAAQQRRVEEIKTIQTQLLALWILLFSLVMVNTFRWVLSDVLEYLIYGLFLVGMQFPYLMELSKIKRYASKAPFWIQNHITESFLVHEAEVYFFDGEGEERSGFHRGLKLKRITYDRGRIDERPHLVFEWLNKKTYEPLSLGLPVPEGMEEKAQAVVQFLEEKYKI